MTDSTKGTFIKLSGFIGDGTYLSSKFTVRFTFIVDFKVSALNVIVLA